MMTRVPATLWKAEATAPPVSPDVATRTVSSSVSSLVRYAMRRAMNLAPKSLNASVGPWKSSRMLEVSVSGTSGASKLMASSTISLRSWSGMAPWKKFLATLNPSSGKLMARQFSQNESGSLLMVTGM